MSNYGDNHFSFKKASEPIVRQAIKTLLEEKHLYQSVKLTPDKLAPTIEEIKKHKQARLSALSTLGNRSFGPPSSEEQIEANLKAEANKFLSTTPFEEPQLGQENHNIEFSVNTIKTYCNFAECKEILPHNILHNPICLALYNNSEGKVQQVFASSYQCQNCKKEEVNFLIRRDGLRIILSGRSPIEHIEIPPFIPKSVRKFYQGAIVAFNSGATLPAIFMLRTTIEQHMRNSIDVGDNRMTGEELVAEYIKTLDTDFNIRFPSLKPVYEALSIAIHSAKDDEPEIFEKQKHEMLSHFESKDVFDRMARRP